jgi:outer membrane protein TolC
LILFQQISAQQDIRLEIVIDSALAYHPRTNDKELLQKIKENKIDNYTANWYPEISLKGQATYQSDVVEINIDSPVPGFDFPAAPKDQYKAYVDLNQTLFDAGRIRKMKEMESLAFESSILETEKDIEKVKNSVIDLYYNILMLQENLEILKISLQQIEKNISRVHAAVENGTSLPSDIDVFRVEKLDILQQMENLKRLRKSSISMLSSLTGMTISNKDNFIITDLTIKDTAINRKELELLRQNRVVLNKSSEIAKSARLPVAFAFGQFGYGNPGLNLLNDEFDTWYMVGLGLRWQIWDWNQTNRERSNIEYQAGILQNKEEELTESIERASANQKVIIENHQKNIASYEEILSLREKITETYEHKLEEGTITTLELLNVTNQEKIMRIKLNNERISLQKSIAEYELLTGNL